MTPLTNPAFIARMKELDQKFTSMKLEMAGVAPKVEPIDWASFEATIENKALVASLRKEYESMQFGEIQGEDLTKINADLDFAITKASGAAEISRAEIPKVKAALAAAIAEKSAVHGWTSEDYFARYPGLEEQMRADYMNADYLPTDAEERLEAQDYNEARKQFKSGAELVMPEDMATKVGDYDLNTEIAKVDALLEKMFGGSKAYDAVKAADKAAAAKKAAALAAKKAHEEHH